MKLESIARIGTYLSVLCLVASCGGEDDSAASDGHSDAEHAAMTESSDDGESNSADTTSADTTSAESDTSLSAADELTSAAPDCPDAPPGGFVSCVTVAEDITAFRALTVGKCGIDMAAIGFPGCIELGKPGELDTSCPEIDLGGGPMPGCCTAAGQCGNMDTAFGFGCGLGPDPASHTSCG